MTARRVAARAKRGFSLLEVMVALAILASALLAVSEVVGGALRNHVRASELDVATLLAQGKLAELEDQYETEGFRDFDQTDEGTFEEEGHPAVRWRVEVVKPAADLGPERLLALLGGGGGELGALLGQASQREGEPQSTNPATAAVAAGLQAQLTAMGEQIKKGVREVRLTVTWPDGRSEASFTVVTHLAVLTPRGGA